MLQIASVTAEETAKLFLAKFEKKEVWTGGCREAAACVTSRAAEVLLIHATILQ